MDVARVDAIIEGPAAPPQEPVIADTIVYLLFPASKQRVVESLRSAGLQPEDRVVEHPLPLDLIDSCRTPWKLVMRARAADYV
eukprot:306971-Lingulodinium_polyedra.AAC.1